MKIIAKFAWVSYGDKSVNVGYLTEADWSEIEHDYCGELILDAEIEIENFLIVYGIIPKFGKIKSGEKKSNSRVFFGEDEVLHNELVKLRSKLVIPSYAYRFYKKGFSRKNSLLIADKYYILKDNTGEKQHIVSSNNFIVNNRGFKTALGC